MALGTLTVVESYAADGPVFIDRVTIVGDGAYATGGTTGLLAKLRTAMKDQRKILSVMDEGTATNKAEYDVANEKLLAYVRATGAQVANATDLSGTTFKLVVTSR